MKTLWMPYENTEVYTYIAATYSYQMLICIYNLTDDETFSLWDGSDFVFVIQSKIDLLIISDWLCLSALIFCAIEISVKSHISTSLANSQNHYFAG